METLPPRMVRFGSGMRDDVPASEFGTKAANLALMSALGIPVPPGFTLGVSVCEDYYLSGGQLPPDVPDLLRQGIAFLEQATGRTFGGPRSPLLVSVRSGAPASMPGVLETLLNVGFSRETIPGLLLSTGNPRFAWDSYRRLLENYGTVVACHEPSRYRALLREVMNREGVGDETELDAMSLRDLAGEYERIYHGTDALCFPPDAFEQLVQATGAVLRSWSSPRAEAFRRLKLVRGVRGTAVTVQAMVFGNMGANSGAGVAFTRNPWSGADEMLVDFRFGAQGEDVVSGEAAAVTREEFARRMPEVCSDLATAGKALERHFREMQDLEFTVQQGRLNILQSRSGKRAPLASLRIAVEMCREGIITPEEAIDRLREVDLEAVAEQRVIKGGPPLARGLSASGGVASGRVILTSDRAVPAAAEGPVILVRETASPDDLPGISAAKGLLVARGARTSHAAVVARQMGKVCIVNCTSLSIDLRRRRCRFDDQEVGEGDVVTLDGDAGAVYRGYAEVERTRPLALIAAVEEWRRALKP
jgi:pyruvate, orthophosphate dikinase